MAEQRKSKMAEQWKSKVTGILPRGFCHINCTKNCKPIRKKKGNKHLKKQEEEEEKKNK